MSARGRVAEITEAALGQLVTANNARIHRIDAGHANPWDLGAVPWHRAMAGAYPTIRSEWDDFCRTGGRLPLIEELILESQGNQGDWRAGLLVSRGRPCAPLASVFPATIGALLGIPRLRSALWSVFEPGTELPEHAGPNAGMLRYHIGVRCDGGAGLRVGDVVVPYVDGEGVLFDDTVPHSAWNRGAADRVTLFCEIERPLPPLPSRMNRVVQAFISLDPRYRHAPARALEWHRSYSA